MALQVWARSDISELEVFSHLRLNRNPPIGFLSVTLHRSVIQNQMILGMSLVHECDHGT